MRYWVLFGVAASLWSCGNGDFTVDTNNGLPSNIDLKGDPNRNIDSVEAKAFFEENLWPLMKESSGTGCAAGGCHELTDDPNVFFSVDEESAENSWNWAKVRRFELTAGDYLDLNAAQSPQLLLDQMEINHFNFSNWSADQKSLVEEWAEIE